MEFSVSFTELASDKNELDNIKFPNELRWDHTAENIISLTESIMKESESTINQLVSNKEPRTFENTIKVLAKFESDMTRKSTQLGF